MLWFGFCLSGLCICIVGLILDLIWGWHRLVGFGSCVGVFVYLGLWGCVSVGGLFLGFALVWVGF